MVRAATRRAIPFTLCTTCTIGFLACNSPTISTDFAEGRISGISSQDRLTSTEWTQYKGNAQYLRELAPENVSVEVNLADPRQYNATMARLKLVGKNATNSPHLFERIQELRSAQIARGLKAGALAAPAAAASTDAQAMHYIGNTAVRNGTPPTGAAPRANAAQPPRYAVGSASSTFPGGTDYTSVDISISTIAHDPLGETAYKEEFGNPNGNTGANVTISTTGNPNLSSLTRYTFESYEYVEVGPAFTIHYAHSEIGTNAPQAPGGLPQLGTPTVVDPRDKVGPNGGPPDMLISACMDRAWTNDCDYIVNTGSVTDHRIKLPVKGSVPLTTTHVFDAATIEAIKTALNANQVPPIDPGFVKLVLTNVGGGCDVDALSTLSAPMAGFWNHVTLSADGTVLFWDSTEANALFFDEGCSQIQDRAAFTMRIIAPAKSVPGGIQSTVSFTISNDPDTLRPDAIIPPLTLTNSCLAAGTQIELSTGNLAAIETLQIGQSTFNPYVGNDHALTIMDTASGTEPSPMVRIRDEAGHTLLMTEMHPIATPDRGMVQARALRSGDLVMTTQGPSRLVEVSREAYTGKVYNLKVGSTTQMASLGQDQTVVHANGFVVGDGQIQSKYEVQALKQSSRTTLEQVPERWRRDFLLSPARK